MAFEFFTIILSNSSRKLRLPDKFAKVFDRRQPRELMLREAGRRRRLWAVDVVFDADGHMYLGHGWKQFARAHDLRLGHLLILSYNGHAVLTVKVFDGSMCRRHYQNNNDASSGSSSDSGNTLGGEGEEEAPPQTRAEEHDVEQGVSKMTNPCDSDESQKERSYSSEELSAEDSLSADNSLESANLQTLSNNYVVSVQCYLTKAQKVKIDALIERIQPKFTVLVVQMKKWNIKRHTLIIQKDYALEHFPCEDTTVILQLPGKNKGWKCTFRIRPSGASDAGRRNLFLHNFAYDNHVREGDICLFQPMTNVEQRRFIVRVHILKKACIDGTTQSPAGEGSDSDRCPKERSSHYYKSANTPAVSYNSKEFSEENPPAYESVQLHDPQMPSKDYVLAGKCDLTLAQEKKIQALVGKIRPEILVLVAQMKKSNVDRGRGTLAIPKDYALKYFPRESTSIILQLPSKNKAWKCRLNIRPSGVCNPGRRSLYWRSFAIENHVREGDICLFQPMTNDKHRTFIVIVHLLHKASVESSPGERSDVASNHGRTSAKMVFTANVKEEPASDGEEISPSGHEDDGDSDYSEGASEPLFVAPERPRLTPVQKKKVLEKVHAIDSELPICVTVMSNTSVRLCKSGNSNSGPYLTFSKQYVSRYLEKQYFTGHRAKKNVISLVLQRERGSRRWHTELRLGNNRVMIVKGWTSFARDNRLQVDDLCLFKLMRNEETLKMMVYIIRRKKCLA